MGKMLELDFNTASTPLVFPIPAEKVFLGCFWRPNTSSQGAWMSRDYIIIATVTFYAIVCDRLFILLVQDKRN